MAYEPAAAKDSPRAYYLFLRSQGIPPLQAVQKVEERFGPPKTDKEKANDAQRNALAQQGGSIAGLLLTSEIMRGFPNLGGLFKPSGTPSPTSTSTTPTADVPSNVGNVNTPPATEVGSVAMPDGSPGTLMSDGGKVGQNGEIINPDGTSGGSIEGQALAGLQVVGGAAQAYNGYKQFQSGEKLGGAANVAGGAFNAAAGTQTLLSGGTAGSLAQYAPGVGTAVAAAQIGQQMLNEKGNSEDRAAKSQAEAQKAAMLWIPGYGWIAYAALSGLDAVTGGKATEALMKYNKFSNKVTDKIDFGLGKNIRGKVFHQSTKGRQEERTGQLLQQSNDPVWQNYVASMRMQQIKEGPKDKLKPFYKGQYATFDEYKKAGLQADDLTGVYGNLDAFKPDYAEKAGLPDWSKLTFEQRKAVTQRLIDEDMYSSKKGDIVIRDKEKARQIYQEMSQNKFAYSPKPQVNAPAPSQPTVPPPPQPPVPPQQPNQVKGPAPLNQPPPPMAPTGKMSIRELLETYMRK
jgi:hypothetical protein